MPVVIALVLAPFQIALWWYGQQIAEGAARESIDAAQVEQATAADGEQAAQRFLAATGNLTETKITVTRDTETVTAEVTGRAARLLPGFAWSVTARAQAPVERFIPEPER